MLAYLIINLLLPLLVGILLFVPFLKQDRRNSDESKDTISLRDLGTSIMFGIFFITYISYLGALLKLSIPTVNFVLSIFLVSVVAVRLFFQKFYFLNSKILFFAFSVIGGYLHYLPVLLEKARSDKVLGIITHGNNDVASYAATSSEFLESGFTNSGHLQNVDLNSFALISSYQTPNSLLAFVSTVLNQKPFVVSVPVMILSIAFSNIAVAAFTQSAWPKVTSIQALIVGLFVNSVAIMTYVESHYFLAQIIALGISAMILESAFAVLTLNVFTKRRILEIGTLFALSFYSYPHFLIPFMGVVYSTLFIYIAFRRSSLGVSNAKNILVGASLGFMFCLPYFGYAINFALAQAGVVAGWRLLSLNPLDWIIGSVEDASSLSNSSSAIVWVLFMAASITFIGYVSRERRTGYFGLIVSLVFTGTYLLVVLLRDGDFLSYSSWKLLSYFFPLFIALLSGAIISFEKLKLPFYLTCVAAVIINSVTVWNVGYISTTRDDVELQSNSRVLSQNNLVIDLSPYFQTMQSASLLSDTNLVFKSLSYWPNLDLESGCSLVNASNNEYRYKFNINTTYSLASNSLTDCRNVLHKVRPGDKYEIQALKSILGNGWSQIESWGVWSEGPVSSLLFEMASFGKRDVILEIEAHPFLTESHTSSQVDVFVNNVKVKVLNFRFESPNRTLTVEFSSSLCDAESNTCEIQFKTRNPKSPASLGLSQDERLLGIGLTSVSFNLKN
jgi:hypothetical protein